MSRVNLGRRFTILSEIGQGSMSKVYRALDKKNSQSVCLKVQIPEKNLAAAARATQQQRPDEGEIGLRISHPHVVRTFEYGMSSKGEHFRLDGVYRRPEPPVHPRDPVRPQALGEARTAGAGG